MLIDLNRIRDIYNINEEIDFSEDYYKNTSIKKLIDTTFNGKIFYDYENNLRITGKCRGTMILEDAITLDDINYPFSFELDEILDENNEEIAEYFENSKNTLDIIGVLWQNIVLEVPMRVTNSKIEDIKTTGEGWELVNEKKKEIDPRLAKLAELLDDSGKE